MKNIHSIPAIALIAFMFNGNYALAQQKPADSVAVKHATPWERIPERDLAWQRLVWKDIDARDKENNIFKPDWNDKSGKTMVNVLVAGVKNGDIVAYSPVNDRFDTKLTTEQVQDIFKADTIVEEQLQIANGETKKVTIIKEFNPETVYKYRIKEMWFYSEKLQKTMVRVVGLAPLKEVRNKTDNTVSWQPMFWVFYPDGREYLALQPAHGDEPAANNWEQIFEKRLFTAEVTKMGTRN